MRATAACALRVGAARRCNRSALPPDQADLPHYFERARAAARRSRGERHDIMTELALREELSRKEDALAKAQVIRLLQRQLEESPGAPAAASASARLPEAVLESQEKVLEKVLQKVRRVMTIMTKVTIL